MRVEMGVMDSLDRKERQGETGNQEVMVHLDLMGDPADKALMDLLDSQVWYFNQNRRVELFLLEKCEYCHLTNTSPKKLIMTGLKDH